METFAMDAIEGLDDGANALFTFQVDENPALVKFLQPAYFFSSYLGVVAILAVILAIHILRKHWRAALVSLLAFTAAVAVIQLVQLCVARPRPQRAVDFIQSDSIVYLGDG